MSDTKWRKLISAVAAAHSDIDAMFVKFVDVEEPRSMRFPPSLACPHAYMDTIEFGPVALRAIEWLELPADVSASLEPLGRFPLDISTSGTRVTGYRR